MKNKVITLVAVAALGMATFGIYSGDGFADNKTPVVPAVSLSSPTQIKRIVHCRIGIVKQQHRSPWQLGLHRNKQLTPENAKTITQAALLMKHRPYLQVGQIQQKMIHQRKMYLINIVNKNNKVVQTVVMNSSNGHIHPYPVRSI